MAAVTGLRHNPKVVFKIHIATRRLASELRITLAQKPAIAFQPDLYIRIVLYGIVAATNNGEAVRRHYLIYSEFINTLVFFKHKIRRFDHDYSST